MKSFFLLFTLSITCAANAQSLVKEFLSEQVPNGGRSFYLYQSTIRSFSDNSSANLNKLIKNVEKISIHILPDSLEQTKLSDLEKLLRANEYKDSNKLPKGIDGIVLLVNTESKRKQYAAIVAENGKSVVIELDGDLNLLYINSLKELNMQSVLGFFGVEIPQPTNEAD